ncbi:MAG: DUF423 domain-containing protein [Rhodothermales bacterium]
MMNNRLKAIRWGMTGALLAGAGVALGAFGAHTLADVLSVERLETYGTGISYLQYHALAILVVAWLAGRQDLAEASVRLLFRAAQAFALGILFFTGSLVTLSVTGITWLGAVAPVGGVAFMTGWVLTAVGISRSRLLRTEA